MLLSAGSLEVHLLTNLLYDSTAIVPFLSQFISQFTAQADSMKGHSVASFNSGTAHIKTEAPLSSRKRRRSFSSSLSSQDEHEGVVFSPSPSDPPEPSLSPAVQPRQMSPGPSERRNAAVGAPAPSRRKSARTDYFGHWNKGAGEEMTVSEPRADDAPATTSLAVQPSHVPTPASASASGPTSTSTSTPAAALPPSGMIRRRPHSFHGGDPRQYLTPPPILKIEDPTGDQLTCEDLTPHRQRWAMLESGPAVPFSPGGRAS